MSSSTESLLDYDSSDHGRGISGRSFAFRGLVLEPAVLLLFFSIDLSGADDSSEGNSRNLCTNALNVSSLGVVIQNQIIFQTCTVVYGYNKSDCLLLGTQHPNHNTAVRYQSLFSFIGISLNSNELAGVKKELIRNVLSQIFNMFLMKCSQQLTF